MLISSEFFGEPSVQSPAGSSVRELVNSSEGGYSQIWRFDRGGRFRVLKCLKEDFRGDPLYERLLQKEFEIGYSLDHEGICEYYSLKKDAELGNCLEMEWVDGRTLEHFLSEKKHDRSVYDKIVYEICASLSYMHAKQVLHRDLKPSNILITYNGNNVKLIDFGLSDADFSSVLKTPAGTAVFAAPEVRSGGKASVRSDLYSLGMVISLFPVRKYSPIVRRLCSQKPEERYSSVVEVQKALKSNMSVIAGIVFILFIALMAIAPMLEKRIHQAPAPEPTVSVPDSVVPASDTAITGTEPAESDVILSEAKNLPDTTTNWPVKGRPRQAPKPKPAPTKSNDTHLIDELFRQATELFE